MCASSQIYYPLKHLVNSLGWSGTPKRMAFYSGYFDESGGENTPIFVLAGFVMDVEDPAPFERQWTDAISPLSWLHTSEFMAGRNEFYQWNHLGLNGKGRVLQSTAKVIAQHATQTFSIALGMEAYRSFDREYVFSEAIAHPYSLCARFASVQVGQWSRAHGMANRIRMVFDARSTEDKIETISVFDRDGLPNPVFEDTQNAAMQAADLLAWLYHVKINKTQRYAQLSHVYAELNQSLHTHDVLDEATFERISDQQQKKIPKRSDMTGKVRFHNDLDRSRKGFKQ
jgi:Protein of unknown function (DUF3800)